MKKFIKNIILFFVLAVVIGEVVVRSTHAMADIPQRTIDDAGIQKYFPNQEGYWKGGDHKWMINKLGWPGKLPQSYDKLIMVIGDSYIENFMNPSECHQSAFLKENMPNYNFMEAGRAGVSLIEAMEISEQLDSLQPTHSLIYVSDHDIYESISQVRPMKDITQLDIKTNTIVYGEMKAPGLKKILYSWKLLYYFYNRFPLNKSVNDDVETNNTDDKKDLNENVLEFKTETTQLLDFIKNNYKISNKTLVFHPNSNSKIIEICKTAGFKIIELNSDNDKNWRFENDHHWTCYGHKRAAQQISKKLLNSVTLEAIK